MPPKSYFANSVLVHFTVPQVVLYEKQTDSLQTKCLQTAYLTIDLYKSKLVVRIISLFCLVENEYGFQLCKKSKRMSATMLQWPLFRRTKICVFLCLIVCVSKNLIINHIYISRHLQIRYKENKQILVCLNKGCYNIIVLILLLFLQSWKLFSYSTKKFFREIKNCWRIKSYDATQHCNIL